MLLQNILTQTQANFKSKALRKTGFSELFVFTSFGNLRFTKFGNFTKIPEISELAKILRKKFGNLSSEIPSNTNRKCTSNTKILSKTT